MSAEEARARIAREVKMLGLRNMTERKAYDGKVLIILEEKVSRSAINLKLGKAPSADISHPLPPVRIRSPDYAWTKPVVDCCLSMWSETSDLLKTCVAVARVIDEVNERIRTGAQSPGHCDCTPSMAAPRSHPCSRCGTNTLCSLLAVDLDGFRACEQCLQKSFVSGNQRRAILSLERAARRERQSIAPERLADVRSLVAIGGEWISRQLEGQYRYRYRNAYSGAVIQQVPEMRHPTQITCDAVFPISIGNEGKTMIHWVDNIGLVPHALNSCKHAHLPIFLETVAEYCRQVWPLVEQSRVGDVGAIQEVQRLQQQFIAACSRFAYIRNKLPWTIRARLALRLSAEQFRYYKRNGCRKDPFRQSITGLSWAYQFRPLGRVVEVLGAHP